MVDTPGQASLAGHQAQGQALGPNRGRVGGALQKKKCSPACKLPSTKPKRFLKAANIRPEEDASRAAALGQRAGPAFLAPPLHGEVV